MVFRPHAVLALVIALVPAVVVAQADARTAGSRAPVGSARALAHGLTEAEAHALIVSTFVPAARRFPGRTFEPMPARPRPPGFWVWEAQADPGPERSPVLGHFAVNRRTGDVWDLADCTRARSAGIMRVQRRQRARLGAATFGRLSAVAPCTPAAG